MRGGIQFLCPEEPAAKRRWWLIVERGQEVDLCSIDPGFDIVPRVVTDLRTMTAVWIRLTTVRAEIERHRVQTDGDPTLARSMHAWLGLSPFAGEPQGAAG